MKNILITGAAGMLGMNLCEVLVAQRDAGTELTIYGSDDFSRHSHARKSALSRVDALDKMEIKTAPDIRLDNRDYYVDWCRHSGIDTIINCAADVGGVFHNRANQETIFAHNALLQSLPVSFAAEAGVQTFVQMSSVCVYEPVMGYPDDYHIAAREHRESDGLIGVSEDNTGYALAKRAGESIALASKIPHVLVIRPTNMTGMFDHFDDRSHVIPSLIKQALTTGSIRVSSSPDVERDFLSAQQAAHWIMDLLDVNPERTNRQIFNLPASLNGRLTISAVANAIAGFVGDCTIEYVYDDSRQCEATRRVSGDKLFDVIKSPVLRDNLLFVIESMIERERGLML